MCTRLTYGSDTFWGQCWSALHLMYIFVYKDRYTSHSQQCSRADGICMYTCTLHKSQGNDFEIDKYTAGLIWIWKLFFWWLTFVTDLLDLATYQFWSIISSPNSRMHCNLSSSRCLSLCAFYEGTFNMHSNLIYIKWNQKFTGKLDIYLCHHPVAFVLLFWKNMVLKSNGGKNCLQTLFPFLALGENIQNETAQIGAKTTQIGTKMGLKQHKILGTIRNTVFFAKRHVFFQTTKENAALGNDTFSAHQGGIVYIYIYTFFQLFIQIYQHSMEQTVKFWYVVAAF